jgi:hypothetical protein
MKYSIDLDGGMFVPSALNMGAAFQTLSTLDPASWIDRTVEGTVWGTILLDHEGWRVVGDQGVVVAIREGTSVDLSSAFAGSAPASVYQLPVVDGAKSLLVSIDPGATAGDTLIRTWWVDTACLAQ